MLIDALEQLVTWWSDPADGINATLAAGVPGAVEAVPAVTIKSELDEDWLAGGMVPRDAIQPGVAYWLVQHHDQEQQGFPAPVLPEQEVRAVASVLATYVVRAVATKQLVLNARRTCAAAHRVIAKRFEDTSTAFEVNATSTVLFVPPEVRYLRVVATENDLTVLAGLLVPVPLLDRWALGLT